MEYRKESDNTDQTLALLGMVFSALFAFSIGLFSHRLIYSLTGVFTFFACLSWLFLRRRLISGESIDSKPIPVSYRICVIAFVALLSLSVITLHTRPQENERPLSYFVLTSLMIGVVALEILASSKGKAHIGVELFQIILIGTSLELSQVIVFPTVVGIDPWWHRFFVSEILSEGHIPQGFDYSNMPVFHTLIAVIANIMQTDYRVSAFVGVSLIQVIVSTLFVYLIGRSTINGKVGLLAGLMLAIANSEIHMGFWAIPTTIGIVFIPCTLHLMLRALKGRNEVLMLTALCFMSVIILTHPLAALALSIILLVGYVCLNSNNHSETGINRSPFSLTTLAMYTIAMLAFWSHATRSLDSLVKLFIQRFSIEFAVRAPHDVISYSSGVPFYEELFNNLGVFLFFAISFIGCLWMMSIRFGNRQTRMIALSGLLTLILPFASLIGGLEIVNDRWWTIAMVLLSTPVALCIFLLFGSMKWRILKHIIAFVLVCILAFVMIMSTAANLDNRTFSRNTGVRAALTEPEIVAVDEVGSVYSGVIGTDLYFRLVSYVNPVHMISIDDQLHNRSFDKDSNTLILIRREIVNNPFFLYTSLPWKLDYNPLAALDQIGYSKVYDSNSVTAWSWTT